jgi:hypothetical protein
MELRDGHIYLLPDGRRLRARKEEFAGFSDPAWTLEPIRPRGMDRPPLLLLARSVYVERARLFRFEMRDDSGHPRLMVRDCGWTVWDLVDLGPQPGARKQEAELM